MVNNLEFEKALSVEIEDAVLSVSESPSNDELREFARHFAEFGQSNAFKGYVVLLPEVYQRNIDKAKKEAVEEYADKRGRPKIYRGEMMVLKGVADKDGVCLQELAKKLEPFVVD